MKGNAPKRKVFQDALDILTEDPVENKTETVNGIVSQPVNAIHPFQGHPFWLYEGERLDDMVQSIRNYGILNPVIVRICFRQKKRKFWWHVMRKSDVGEEEMTSCMRLKCWKKTVDTMSTSRRKAVMGLVNRIA